VTDDPPSRPLVAVGPAAEIDSLYAEMHLRLERLEAELVEAEAAALRAEARLAEFEPFDPDVVRRVTAHTDRVVESITAEAGREAEEWLADARRVAAQRVGEAAAEAERQIADARQQVEQALAMAHRASPVDRPPIVPSREPAMQTWESDGHGPWIRRLPAALIAQLIGAVLVLALILVRVG
jgi:hypothetical protein